VGAGVLELAARGGRGGVGADQVAFGGLAAAALLGGLSPSVGQVGDHTGSE